MIKIYSSFTKILLYKRKKQGKYLTSKIIRVRKKKVDTEETLSRLGSISRQSASSPVIRKKSKTTKSIIKGKNFNWKIIDISEKFLLLI